MPRKSEQALQKKRDIDKIREAGRTAARKAEKVAAEKAEEEKRKCHREYRREWRKRQQAKLEEAAATKLKKPKKKVMFPRFSMEDTTGTQQQEEQKAKDTYDSLLNAMWRRTNPNSLNLATDLFDDSTGLHSEGVWHNSLAGITCVRLQQYTEARRIADSLLNYSWEGKSF